MSTQTPEALKAGWGTADITPEKTAQLYGQYYQRVSRAVRDPLSVTAMALEQPCADRSSGQAVLVSCDVTMVGRAVLAEARGRLAKQVPDFDVSRLVVSATHTHCAPAADDPLKWWEHDPALLSMDEFRSLLVDGIVSASARAWKTRSDAQLGSASGLASIGHCRRPLYRDGSSEMYGTTNRPDFIGMESGEDDTVGVIGAWTPAGELTGLLVNVACPSQVMEATYVVTADMFGEMRRRLRERLGRNVSILCQVGAAGDQAPRDLTSPYTGGPTYWDEPGLVALGGRLAEAVMETLPRAQASRQGGIPLRHAVCTPRLPVRIVTPADYACAVSELASLAAREPADPGSPDSVFARFTAHVREREKLPVPGPYDDKNDDFVLMRNLEGVVNRFHQQRREPSYKAELHVLRLGDMALSTSPFELYLDYGLRIRARSPAALTLHAELTCDEAGYLPTFRAVEAGGYGALVANGLVGPEGGQLLVESILSEMERLFSPEG
jgi:hypothetical protein